MTIRVAINGYGRIGRMVLRALYEDQVNGKPRRDIKIVAINAMGDIDINAHLTQYDSAHGRFPAEVKVDGDCMVVNGDRIKMFSTRNPLETPWGELGVDLVLECSGKFTSKEKAMVHISQGAKKVLISAPGEKDVDATIVYGVNQQVLKPSDSAVSSMIPTKTGAAKAVGLVLPALAGRFDGFAMRVPVINVSVVDLTFAASRATSVDEVNSILKTASEGELKGILGFNTLPLVSIDFNHDPRPSIYDASQTRVSADGKLVKVLAWYDNEWGYSVQMLNAAEALMAVK
jgi:glyceraldehyde 3-phosphate dehydrogenase